MILFFKFGEKSLLMKIKFSYLQEDFAKLLRYVIQSKFKKVSKLLIILLVAFILLLIVYSITKQRFLPIQILIDIILIYAIVLLVLNSNYLSNYLAKKTYKNYINSEVSIVINDDNSVELKDHKGETTFYPNTIKEIIEYKDIFILKPNESLAVIIPFKRIANEAEIRNTVTKLAENCGGIKVFKIF